ncbi:MMPL family transporter [Nocardia aurantia]|uniref:Trehalose monomycolate exporter MmpL3 n=1 Tax=Nocardia aurantia TaxID=2585199 RepID=A0A7K0E0S2_9NOCA|nr:MMPL family transporter [Nocardia aurantia]MQY31481.1 Trehalose monomycolate exporter MmpL3 [Nocardia aurantia]
MLTRLARLTTGHPRTTLFLALAVALVCGLFGSSVAGELKGGGFVPGDAESARSARMLADHFDGADPNLVLLVGADQGVDSPAAQNAAHAVLDRLQARPDVIGLRSYWTSPPAVRATLRSTDAKQGLILAYLTGGDEASERASGKVADELADLPETHVPGVHVLQGGSATMFHEANSQVTKDLAVAETIAVPLTLLVLVLVFGSLVAASLPIAVGVFAILVTLAILRVCALLADVSVFALNMTTAMGLALAIDYSLFIVSRYREELHSGRAPRDAAVRAVATAGRTVLFSALTVALALAVLAVFNLFFLQSFAYAGVAVVAAAAAASIVILPAALVLLGERIDAWDLREPVRRLFRRPAPAPRPLEQTFWYRTVIVVMHRAVPVAVVLVALLLTLGAPFLGVKFGYPDDRVLPPGTSSRAVGDVLRHDFPAVDTGGGTTVLLDGYTGDAAGYAAALSAVPQVSAVLSDSGVYIRGHRMADAPARMANATGQYLVAASNVDPYAAAGKQQLRNLRAVPTPAPTMFGGAAAINSDSLRSLGARLPLALALIVLATMVVLFLFTGSVVLPVKAVVLNTLSLSAMFGMMVWIFQEGHLSRLIGFTPTGTIVPTMPILMFCVAFGMSMDYEVFLLSRIREAWLASARTREDNVRSVAIGVARTGRIVTAAALLMAIVLGALVSSKVSFMQMFGLGLTLTVLSDATLIRGLLVPALMRLMGTANWWAPRPLARLHERLGLHEEDAADLETAGAATGSELLPGAR